MQQGKYTVSKSSPGPSRNDLLILSKLLKTTVRSAQLSDLKELPFRENGAPFACRDKAQPEQRLSGKYFKSIYSELI